MLMTQRLLFQKLPVSLFVPLAAPLAELYADVLLRLFIATQQHQEPLSWELCISLIVEIIEDREHTEQLTLWEEAPPEEGENAGRDTRSRATEILRHLKQYQWLREEIQADGTLVYSLPEIAFRLLRLFHEIATGREERLQGVICNIHDLLQAAVREGNASIRIPQALQETHRLLSRLKELQHTIGLHIEHVLKQTTLKDILEHSFIAYLHQVTRSSYHELRTTDHVSRFRLAIYEAISLLHMRYQEGSNSLPPHQEFLSAQDLLDDLAEIQEQFDQLDDLLQAIDLRHSQFFDAAVRAIQLKLGAATRTSGHLHRILRTLMQKWVSFPQEQQDGEDSLPFTLDQLIVLHSLEWLDAQSLMSPRRPSEPFVPAPDTTLPPSQEAIEAARLETLQRLSRAYSRERVRRFAAKLLGEQDEQRIGAISLSGPDDLPMLIYLRQYGKDGALGYVVEEVADAAWIERAGIGFRDFLVRRVGSGSSPPTSG
jgi:hypothetical protein